MILSREKTKMTRIGPDILCDFFVTHGEPIRIQDPQFRIVFSHSNSPHVAKVQLETTM
jgi:hypothetical protein